MISLGILELVIGIFFVYFVFSVVCTAIVEGIAQFKSLRSAHLHLWIEDSFGNLGKALINHGLVKNLTEKTRTADYIPANIFSAALLDLIYENYRKKHQTPDGNSLPITYDFNTLEAVLTDPDCPLPEDMRRYLLQAIEDGRGLGQQIDLIKKRLDNWYAEAMELVIGTYKRRTRVITWVVGISVTVFANIDSLELCKYLNDNPETRTRLVAMAEAEVKDSNLYQITLQKLENIQAAPDSSSAVKQDSILRAELRQMIQKSREDVVFIKAQYDTIAQLGLPLGWNNGIPTEAKAGFLDFGKWFFLKLTGLFVTALALTLGAPFWFDMINKLVNIRTAGKKPEDKPEPK